MPSVQVEKSALLRANAGAPPPTARAAREIGGLDGIAVVSSQLALLAGAAASGVTVTESGSMGVSYGATATRIVVSKGF
jgi:hypothetical protein